MRLIVLMLVWCACPLVAVAFVAIETDQSEPFELVPIEGDPAEARSYLGRLVGVPIMYELVAEASTTVTMQVAEPVQQPGQEPALLLVRRNDRGGGVTEIMRQAAAGDRARVRHAEAGLSFWQSPPVTVAIAPGTYQLEVSSPQNEGAYLLTIGTSSPGVGYWESVRSARVTQRFFGYGSLSLLQSRLVYQPLGLLLLLFLVYKAAGYYRATKKDHAPA